jgi:hypothetical protein
LEGRLKRLPRLAAELVALKLHAMLAASTPPVLAAKKGHPAPVAVLGTPGCRGEPLIVRILAVT